MPPDRGDGGAGLRAFAREAARHDLDQTADVDRILADEQRLGAMNELGDAGAPVGLAEAGEAGVGLDANEDPGKVAVDDGGADVGDLHARALVLGQAARASWVSESKRWSFSWSNAIQTGSSGRIGICGSRLTTMTAEPR